MTEVTFNFLGNLQKLLKKKIRTGSAFCHRFERRASIKDVIESLGIPHPVVGKLTVNGHEVDFDYILRNNDTVDAVPLTPPVNPLVPTKLRPEPLERIAFIVDVNAGRLALFLRMLGFDTLYGNDMRNGRLAEIARSENRILLTRDTTLLKRKVVIHGYLLREQAPDRQLVEVMRLYGLSSLINPMSRCIPCNGILVPVDKKMIIERLEPLTKKYYHSFHICKKCEKIYWPGSHQLKMKKFIDAILASVNRD